MTSGPVDPAQRATTVGGWPTQQSADTGAGATTTARRSTTVGAAATARRPSRRARLTVKRIDPWSMLKFSFFYGLAGLVVLFVVVILLYSIIDAMGVLDSLRSFFTSVDSQGSSSVTQWFSLSRVLLVTVIVGLINVVLFTAFATLTAFIYNVCTDVVGGVEVTLAERS